MMMTCMGGGGGGVVPGVDYQWDSSGISLAPDPSFFFSDNFNQIKRFVNSFTFTSYDCGATACLNQQLYFARLNPALLGHDVHVDSKCSGLLDQTHFNPRVLKAIL